MPLRCNRSQSPVHLHVGIALAAIVMVAAGCGGSTPSPGVAGGVTVVGTWSFTIDVTDTSGECAGEEADRSDPNDPDPYTWEATITESGGSIGVVGLGDPGETWKGTLNGNRVEFSGDRTDGGPGEITEANFSLTVAADGKTMTGSESWRWDDTGRSGLECPLGLSGVVATKIG